jgi:uncharacterized protein YkwD
MTSRRPLALVLMVVGCAAGPVIRPAPGSTDTTPTPSDVGTDVVWRTNAERLRAGLPALARSAKLMEAARLHAEQMASRQRLEHTIADVPYATLQARLQAVAYVYARAAENIAWNQSDAAAALDTWMRSPGHRANILDPQVSEMGAAMVRSARGEPYWVQVFAHAR